MPHSNAAGCQSNKWVGWKSVEAQRINTHTTHSNGQSWDVESCRCHMITHQSHQRQTNDLWGTFSEDECISSPPLCPFPHQAIQSLLSSEICLSSKQTHRILAACIEFLESNCSCCLLFRGLPCYFHIIKYFTML